jgi:hypothetical protein
MNIYVHFEQIKIIGSLLCLLPLTFQWFLYVNTGANGLKTYLIITHANNIEIVVTIPIWKRILFFFFFNH